MTERERVEATYNKVQKRYPALVEEAKINQVAVQIAQRRALWVSIAFLCGSLVCVIAWLLLSDGTLQNAIRGILPVLYIELTFEYFRTSLNSAKIKKHYGYDGKETYQGMVTYNQVVKDIRKTRKNLGQDFQIVKASLCDKNDRDESAVSWIFHKYNLFFQLDNSVDMAVFRVRRKVYLNAPLNAPYILVLSQSGNVLAAYNANAWDVSIDLATLCSFDILQHNSFIQKIPAPTAVKHKNIVWNILLLILLHVAYFLPVVLALAFMPVVIFFATRFTVKDKNWLSLFNMILGHFTLTWLVIYLCLS